MTLAFLSPNREWGLRAFKNDLNKKGVFGSEVSVSASTLLLLTSVELVLSGQ